MHGHITTEEVRALAKRHLGSIAHGEDPVEQKRQTQALFIMQDLAHDYIERHGQKKRAKSLLEDQKLLKNIILLTLGYLKVENLCRREVENLHLSLEKTPYQVNRVLSLLSKMFSLAVSWGWRADNPALKIQKYQGEKRDRWLNDEEVQRL